MLLQNLTYYRISINQTWKLTILHDLLKIKDDNFVLHYLVNIEILTAIILIRQIHIFHFVFILSFYRTCLFSVLYKYKDNNVSGDDDDDDDNDNNND